MLPIPFSSTITNVHGNDEGCVRAESKPIIIIYRIPFSFANNLMSENELKNPGIYFLVRNGGAKDAGSCDSHNGGSGFTGSGLIGSNVPTIYVGQGDSHDDGSGVLKRMVGKHAEGVDEWDVGYALTCGTPNLLDATALNWLERYFYDKACAVGRYQVLNSVRPPGKEPDMATKGVLMNFIEIAEYLLKRNLGLYAFEKVGYQNIPIGFSDSPLIGKQMFLSNAKAGVYAVGVMTGYKSIYVYPGATVGRENRLLKQKSVEKYGKLRKELEEKGIINKGEFAQGYEFSSVSQAAAVIMGTSTNGRTYWKDKDGASLEDILEPGGAVTAENDTADQAVSAETDAAGSPQNDEEATFNTDEITIAEPGEVDLPETVEITSPEAVEAATPDTVEITPPEAEEATLPENVEAGTSVILYLDNEKRNAHAKGYVNDDGKFVVLAGSKVSDSVFYQNEKGGATRARTRKELEDKGIISNLLFTVDHAFSSSSTAASVIYGGSASGPAMWKDENGVSLGELNK